MVDNLGREKENDKRLIDNRDSLGESGQLGTGGGGRGERGVGWGCSDALGSLVESPDLEHLG